MRMRFTSSSATVFLCLCGLLAAAKKHERAQDFTELLFLKHLPDGRVLASFEFTTTWDIHPLTFTQPHTVWHYDMFPRSLAEVIAHYRVQELHLTLTQGKWRTRMWGYPPQSVPPGAEFWTWFLPDTDVDSEWPGLVNAMSGLLCSHLNAIDSTSTHQPLQSFKPQGAIIGNLSSTSLRYAALPRETVCTENLTPWAKLLPCGSTAGLGSLFSAQQLYNSDFHSLGLHFTPHCKAADCSAVAVRFLQTLSVVPKPSTSSGFIEWSLATLFSGPLTSVCPLATESRVLVDTSWPQATRFTLSPPPTSISHITAAGAERELSVYDLHSVVGRNRKFNLAVKSTATVDTFQGMPAPPVLDVQSFLTGSGHEGGGLHTTITNSHPTAELRVLYFNMVPWFTRVYIHSLQVSNGSVLWQHYTPAKDRARPHTLELLLSLPPLSTCTLTLQFSRAFLTWTEHPPDAHHGFYINSAVLTTVLSECQNCTITSTEMDQQKEIVLRLHTEPLLVSLPTPDFSMPYNVICFVCTVIAIGFGSLFNLTTRTLQPASKTQGLIARLLGYLRRKKQDSATAAVASSSNTESSNVAEDRSQS